MKILLVMNGSRERYKGGADRARSEVWKPLCSPGTELEIGYLPSEEASGGISKEYAFGAGEAVKNHAVLYPHRVAQAEQEGYDAVIMHCCSDPGLAEARKWVRIPVIGPGEATLRAGVIAGRSIGVTVPSDASVAHHWRQVRDLGITQHVIGMAPINKPIGKYAEQEPDAMTDALVAAAEELVARGADVICPSGLAFIPVRVSAKEVSKRLSVPVIDPSLVAMRTAEMLVAAMARG